MQQTSPAMWGAAKAYDTWNDLSPIKDKIIVHYAGPATAASGYNHGVEREKQLLRNYEAYHVNQRGWRGVAYGWAIGYSGTVYRCRGWNTYGAHKGDLDDDNISENKEGIPVLFIMGGEQEPSPAMLDSFKKLRLYMQADARALPILPVFKHKDVSSTSCPGPNLSALVDQKFWEEGSKTPVMGPAAVRLSAAVDWLLKNTMGAAYTPEALRNIVALYWTFGGEYGVRADLALAQACKETGYFSYGKDVKPEQYNFAGIGATGGVPGESFDSIAAGVRAHLLRMRMYARNNPSYYNLTVMKRPLAASHWGKYPNIEDFNGVWAYPGVGYGESIVSNYLQPMLDHQGPATLEERVADLEVRVAALEG